MDLTKNIKQSPIIGVAGIGGGTASYILYGTKAGGGGYEISRSLRFNSADTAYLYLDRTGGPVGNRKTHTWSLWAKRSKPDSEANLFTGGTGSTDGKLRFNTNNTLQFNDGTGAQLTTTQVFRDYSAWYHIVVAYDSTQGTASNRIKLYINGEQVTAFSTETYPSPNADSVFSAAHNYYIGAQVHNNANLFDGYLADVHFIDGQALAPTDFGEFDTYNVWNPIAYTGGSYGTNGFNLTFSDNSNNTATTLGKDTSGQGNNWLPYYFSIAAGTGNDSLTDTPTNYGTDSESGGEVRGNYVTLNPLDTRKFTNGPTYTLSNGNLTADMTGGTTNASEQRGLVTSTIDIPTGGKWYMETDMQSLYNDDFALGLASTVVKGYYVTVGNPKPGAYMLRSSGIVYTPTQQLGSDSSRSFSTADLIGIAVDLETSMNIRFYKNGSLVHTESIDEREGPFRFAAGIDAGGSVSYKINVNFGQRAWDHTPPTGFKALCAHNLSDPLIPDGGVYFDTILWDGQGNTNDRTLTTTTSADFVWTKSRSNAYHHALFDTVRGFSQSGGAGALNTDQSWVAGHATGAYLKSATDTSITLAATSDLSNAWYNGASHTYVAWLWDAGTSSSISAGDKNNDVYDTTQTWSSNLSSPGGFYSGYPATYAFNSTYTTAWMASNNVSGDPIEYIHPVAITLTSLRIRFYPGQSHTITVAGTDINVSNVLGPTSFTDIPLPPGGISLNGTSDKIVVDGANWNYVGGFELNGKHLIDNGVSVINVPQTPSTTKANTTSGFSIIKWTGTGSGTSLLHGLTKAPEFVFVKSLGNAREWVVWHESYRTATNTDYIYLNSNGQKGGSGAGDYWNSIPPSREEIFVGNSQAVNNTGDFIAYCFHSVDGYSKVGSYNYGTGTDDNAFVFTGFRPRFVFFKYSSTAGDWLLLDVERRPNGPTGGTLTANVANYEDNYYTSGQVGFDFLSNGFKIRHNGSPGGDSGRTVIYMAFAEHPFKTARAY